MLPPIIGNINSNDILTLYTNPDNGNDRNVVTTRTVSRGRYAEIGVKRSDVFLEPYLQQHGTVQVVNSPSTPPPNPLQHHQLTQLHHVQIQTNQEASWTTFSDEQLRDSQLALPPPSLL